MTVHGLWIGSFVVLAGLAILFTKKTAKDGVPGALLDGRGRLSLSQLQMMLWTLIVLSSRRAPGCCHAHGFARVRRDLGDSLRDQPCGLRHWQDA